MYAKVKSKTKDDIIIPHFCSLGERNAIYYQVMFKIVTCLRLKLNIKQKVELVEERLRKFFNYWLDLANSMIK
jgi:hypothetical protein